MAEIALWCGVPINEVPRKELEQALIETCQQLQRLEQARCDLSIRYVQDLAAMARRRA